MICPITTNIKKNVTILRVNILKGSGGLKKESAVMVDQLRAIDNKRLIRKVGELPTSLRNSVTENLKIILDLE